MYLLMNLNLRNRLSALQIKWKQRHTNVTTVSPSVMLVCLFTHVAFSTLEAVLHTSPLCLFTPVPQDTSLTAVLYLSPGYAVLGLTPCLPLILRSLSELGLLTPRACNRAGAQ